MFQCSLHVKATMSTKKHFEARFGWNAATGCTPLFLVFMLSALVPVAIAGMWPNATPRDMGFRRMLSFQAPANVLSSLRVRSRNRNVVPATPPTAPTFQMGSLPYPSLRTIVSKRDSGQAVFSGPTERSLQTRQRDDRKRNSALAAFWGLVSLWWREGSL